MSKLDDLEKAKANYEAVKQQAKNELEQEIKAAKKNLEDLERQFTELYGKKRGRKPKAATAEKDAVKVKKAAPKKAAVKKPRAPKVPKAPKQ